MSIIGKKFGECYKASMGKFRGIMDTTLAAKPLNTYQNNISLVIQSRSVH